MILSPTRELAAQIGDGTAKISGDTSVLQKLASTMVQFELGFEIMPGTKDMAIEAPASEENPYKVGDVDVHGE